MHRTQSLITLGAGLLALSVLSSGAAAQSATSAPPPDGSSGDDATALAKKLQNPIGDLYSVPFQNNTNFNTGPNKGTQDILNVQPVIPIHINDDWNVITRTILPLVWNPSLQPAQSVPFGLAPTSFSAFLSPNNPVDGWVWGVGPIAELPTITNKTLGSNVWGLGPAAVSSSSPVRSLPARWSTTCSHLAARRPQAARDTACSPSIHSSTTISARVGMSAAAPSSRRTGRPLVTMPELSQLVPTSAA